MKKNYLIFTLIMALGFVIPSKSFCQLKEVSPIPDVGPTITQTIMPPNYLKKRAVDRWVTSCHAFFSDALGNYQDFGDERHQVFLFNYLTDAIMERIPYFASMRCRAIYAPFGADLPAKARECSNAVLAASQIDSSINPYASNLSAGSCPGLSPYLDNPMDSEYVHRPPRDYEMNNPETFRRDLGLREDSRLQVLCVHERQLSQAVTDCKAELDRRGLKPDYY